MHNYFERMYKVGSLIARDRICASIPILSTSLCFPILQNDALHFRQIVTFHLFYERLHYFNAPVYNEARREAQ